jgi:hypothetical protein
MIREDALIGGKLARSGLKSKQSNTEAGVQSTRYTEDVTH